MKKLLKTVQNWKGVFIKFIKEFSFVMNNLIIIENDLCVILQDYCKWVLSIKRIVLEIRGNCVMSAILATTFIALFYWF